MKKVLLAASIVSALSLVGYAHANSGTIKFEGEVTDATCDVVIDNGAGTVTTVDLPPVSKAALSATNSVAGKTQFILKTSNCQNFGGTGQPSKVAAYFKPDATNVDSTNGLLNNIAATDKATNVQLELVDGTNNNTIKAGFASQMNATGGNEFVAITGTSPNGSVSLPYSVQYKSVAGGATAGDVKAEVAFDLVYR
ncbi:type 1 fimbrial protein [Metakosakonia massiliensis]|uniref:Major fimbrial subunit n=1 Tax=Phytobacter massiliensis TaxID=1485952 RepID=A0A6N2ZPP3_9ENTR